MELPRNPLQHPEGPVHASLLKVDTNAQEVGGAGRLAAFAANTILTAQHHRGLVPTQAPFSSLHSRGRSHLLGCVDSGRDHLQDICGACTHAQSAADASVVDFHLCCTETLQATDHTVSRICGSLATRHCVRTPCHGGGTCAAASSRCCSQSQASALPLSSAEHARGKSLHITAYNCITFALHGTSEQARAEPSRNSREEKKTKQNTHNRTSDHTSIHYIALHSITSCSIPYHSVTSHIPVPTLFYITLSYITFPYNFPASWWLFCLGSSARNRIPVAADDGKQST